MSIQIGTQKIRTACGSIIEITTSTVKHLEAHPETAAIIVDAIRKARIGNRPFAEVEVDMGRVVGRKTRVSTIPQSPDEPMVFAFRTGREFPSRVAPDVTHGDETSSVVLIAKRLGNGYYKLVTSWVGNLAEKEPWDPGIRGREHYDRCLKFWCRHALIHNPEIMGPVFESTWNEILASK